MTLDDIINFKDNLKIGQAVFFESLEIDFDEHEKPYYKYLLKKGKLLRMFKNLAEVEYMKLVVLPSGKATLVKKITHVRYSELIIGERLSGYGL